VDAVHDLGLIFSDALAEVIATVTGVYLQCKPPEEDTGFEEITGVMSLCSKKGGILFVSAKESDIRVLCANMTGVSEAEVTKEDIEDALCEFVNMTAGSTKLRLSDPDHMFTLSSPFIIKGKDITIATKSKTHVISSVLGNGEVSVRLKFVCNQSH